MNERSGTKREKEKNNEMTDLFETIKKGGGSISI